MAWRSEVFLCAVLVVCLAGVGQANAAPQDFNQLLRGDYAFTGEAVCVSSATGFSLTFVPVPPTSVFSNNIQGIRTFNGDGTGSVVARSVGLGHPGSANAGDITSDFTYTVAPDRSFTVEHGPVTVTAVAGPGTGTVATITGVKFSGRISQDGKTLVLATEEPNVETRSFTPPIGPPGVDYRICHRARTAIKIK